MAEQQGREDVGTLRMPLVATIDTRNATATLDARIVNCYAEKDEDSEEYQIEKRPGLAIYSTAVGFGPGWGQYYSLISASLYQVWVNNARTAAYLFVNGVQNSTPMQIGGNPYQFNQTEGTPNYIVMQNGVVGYYYNTSTGVLTQITDSNFPAGPAPGWAYLDGTLYISDGLRNIYGSANLDNPTVWSALNVIQARIEPDNIIALSKQLSYVVAFKNGSTEVFYDGANPTGSPLTSVPGSEATIGCANGYSVQRIQGTLVWVASDASGSPFLARMDSLIVRPVSTPAIDKILSAIPRFGGVSSWSFRHVGHLFYGLNISGVPFTIVYDLTEDLFYLWTDVTGSQPWPISSISYSGLQNGAKFAQGASNGVTYLLDADYVYPTDVNLPCPVDIYTPPFGAKTPRRKYLGMMQINADQYSGGQLQIRTNDWDYDPARWTNFRTVDLSTKEPRLRNCGTFKRRSWHLHHQSATPFRITSIDLQLEAGTL